MKTLIALISILLLISCKDSSKPKVSLSKYKANAELIKKVTSKLSRETDPKQLRKAAIAIQQSRLVACTNVENECSLYGEFISAAIKASSDGELSEGDRADLTRRYHQLKKALAKSESLLKSQSSQ